MTDSSNNPKEMKESETSMDDKDKMECEISATNEGDSDTNPQKECKLDTSTEEKPREESDSVTPKSSDEKTRKDAWHGVELGSLVTKFKNLTSPQKSKTPSEEDIPGQELLEDSVVNIAPRLRDKKTQTPKKMELSLEKSSKQGYTSTEEELESPLMTADEIEMAKTSDEELSPSKMILIMKGAELSKKVSPLKAIIHKCRDFIGGSPKKTPDVAMVPTFGSTSTQTGITETELQETNPVSRPLLLEIPASSTSDTASDKNAGKNIFQTIVKKTKEFVRRRTRTESICISDEAEIQELVKSSVPDTPCSGNLGDISNSATIADSSSESSDEMCIEDTKREELLPPDTVEVLEPELLKSQETEDSLLTKIKVERNEKDSDDSLKGLFSTSPKGTSSLQAQEHSKEHFSDNPSTKSLEATHKDVKLCEKTISSRSDGHPSDNSKTLEETILVCKPKRLSGEQPLTTTKPLDQDSKSSDEQITSINPDAFFSNASEEMDQDTTPTEKSNTSSVPEHLVTMQSVEVNENLKDKILDLPSTDENLCSESKPTIEEKAEKPEESLSNLETAGKSQIDGGEAKTGHGVVEAKRRIDFDEEASDNPCKRPNLEKS